MRFLAFVIFFLLLGAFFIISENKIHITNSEGLDALKQRYSAWIGRIGESAANFAGNVVKMEWLPDEELDSKASAGN